MNRQVVHLACFVHFGKGLGNSLINRLSRLGFLDKKVNLGFGVQHQPLVRHLGQRCIADGGVIGGVSTGIADLKAAALRDVH